MHVIWQLAIMHFHQKTRVSGVIIHGSEKMRSKANIGRMIRSYLTRPAANMPLQLLTVDKDLKTKTDAHGGFEFILQKLKGSGFKFSHATTGEELKVIQSYPTEFDFSDRSIHVISDIDDTIMVSHSPHVIKRIKTALTKGPKKRKSIPFTHQLLKSLEEKNAGFYYVSKSESNLYQNITAFIEGYDLPKGKLYLTPFIQAQQLMSYKKDKDHKLKHIRFLIENTEKKPFILIGDDGQRDMEIYASICNEHPDRVQKVYIHQTLGSVSNRKNMEWDQLVNTGVEAEYFKGYQNYQP